jgi:hypothetical protein
MLSRPFTAGVSGWLFLLLLVPPLCATSIAVVRTPSQIVVAADTLEHLSGKPTTVCKIRSTGAEFFAAAGLIDDARAEFHVGRLVSASRANNVAAISSQFEERAVVPLTKALNRIRKDAPAYYASTVVRGGPSIGRWTCGPIRGSTGNTTSNSRPYF